MKNKLLSLFLIFFFIEAPLSSITISELIINYSDFSYVKDISTTISTIYIATTDGIIRYDNINEEWLEPLTGNVDLDENDIQYIWSNDFDDKLYVSTGDRLFEYDSFLKRWYPLREITEPNLTEKHAVLPQVMFAPPEYIYSPSGYLIDKYTRKFPFTVFIDDQNGNYWIGTWGNGTAKAGKSSTVIELLPFGLLQNSVNFIYNDSGLLWLGGDPPYNSKSGLTIFDPDHNTFEYLENGLELDFPVANINCLTSYSDYYLAGTSEGIFFINNEDLSIEREINDKRKLPHNFIYSLETVGDSVFVGTLEGMALISSDGDEIQFFRPDIFLNTRVYGFEHYDSSLWIASSNGAYRLNLNSGNLQKFQDQDIFLFGEVYNITKFENKLWFSTKDGAMYLDIPKSKTKSFIASDNSYRPRAIVANDQFTALGGLNGVTFIFHQKVPIVFRDLTMRDGLLSDNVTSLNLDGDFLWIGTDKGLSRFNWNNSIWTD